MFCGRKGPTRLLRTLTTRIKLLVFIFAPVVICPYFRLMQNMTATPDGPAFGSLLASRLSERKRIGSCSTLGPRCTAEGVAATWDIYLTMGLLPHTYGIASTRQR